MYVRWVLFGAAACSACIVTDFGGKATCYDGDMSSPLLPHFVVTNAAEFTLDVCAKACHAAWPDADTIAVVGGLNPDCYCGAKSALKSKGASLNGCNSPCPGNTDQICGGMNGLASVYSFSCDASSKTPSPTRAAPSHHVTPLPPVHTVVPHGNVRTLTPSDLTSAGGDSVEVLGFISLAVFACIMCIAAFPVVVYLSSNEATKERIKASGGLPKQWMAGFNHVIDRTVSREESATSYERV